MTLHEPAPAVPDRFARSVAVAVHPRQPQFVDVRADETQHRGQERHRGCDRHRDDARCTDPKPTDERQPDREHAQQRNDHGEAGEQHGTSRGVDSGGDGVFGVETRLQPLAVPSDDEQRIVDAHADADHRRQSRREVLKGIGVREQSDDRQSDRDAGERNDDRQHHREHRAERNEQDDDRREDPDPFGRRRPRAL